jgi:hypothetical protein
MLDKAVFDDDSLSRHNLEGMNINSEKFGWMLQAKDHISCEGVHPQGWSADWRAWIKRKEDAGTKITPGVVRGKLAHMMGKYGLLMKGEPADVPYHIWQLGKEARVAYKAAGWHWLSEPYECVSAKEVHSERSQCVFCGRLTYRFGRLPWLTRNLANRSLIRLRLDAC